MSVAQRHPEQHSRLEHSSIPHSGEMPLTLFQREMLLWEVSHPYNAAHVLKISGPAKLDELRRAIEETCRESGIGELDIDLGRKSLRYQPLRSIEIRTAEGGVAPDAVVASIVNEGMNAHFPDRAHYPIRWAVVSEADRRSHHLILLYHHIASDAHGIEALLGTILPRYLHVAGIENDVPLTTSAPGLPEWFVGEARRAGIVRSLLRATAMTHRMRKSHQMPDDATEDGRTRFTIHRAPVEMLARLTAACRRRGVGVNDAFMAALVCAIADRTPDRQLNGARRKIAVGTVLSERRRVAQDLGNFFGVCLSDMLALLDRPDAGVEDVLLQVAEQTRRQKADRAYAAALSIIRYVNIRYLWPIVRIPNHRRSYRRVFPICAGVSTMFVDPVRFGAAGRCILRYHRVCPPGPMAPIVLAPTVFGDQLELCLTYRVASRSAGEAADTLAGVVSNLEAIGAGG